MTIIFSFFFSNLCCWTGVDSTVQWNKQHLHFCCNPQFLKGKLEPSTIWSRYMWVNTKCIRQRLQNRDAKIRKHCRNPQHLAFQASSDSTAQCCPPSPPSCLIKDSQGVFTKQKPTSIFTLDRAGQHWLRGPWWWNLTYCALNHISYVFLVILSWYKADWYPDELKG